MFIVLIVFSYKETCDWLFNNKNEEALLMMCVQTFLMEGRRVNVSNECMPLSVEIWATA